MNTISTTKLSGTKILRIIDLGYELKGLIIQDDEIIARKTSKTIKTISNRALSF